MIINYCEHVFLFNYDTEQLVKKMCLVVYNVYEQAKKIFGILFLNAIVSCTLYFYFF